VLFGPEAARGDVAPTRFAGSHVPHHNGFVVALPAASRITTRPREAEAAPADSEERALFNSIDEGFRVIEFIDRPHGPLSDDTLWSRHLPPGCWK
jgi:hypothetical protein